MSFSVEHIKEAAALLAKQGVFIGTSSWKYAGWRGQLYTDDRYVWRGRFSEARFEKFCLEEYSQVFKTVCVDAAYYKFPDKQYVEGLMNAVPGDFLFGLKVTDEITLKRFPNLPRFGLKAGKPNENFLNANLFASDFIGPCDAYRDKIGVIIFEFSKFHSADYESGRNFAEDLEKFLSRLAPGWPYAVELRNKTFLHSDYFAVLKRNGVAHVFNSWSEMPSVTEQLAIAESLTMPTLCPARFLLKPGRRYEDAVKLFSPYDRIKESEPNAREAGATLIRQGRNSGSRRTFIFVNNRLEGNALETIAAMLEKAEE